jgi:hypothetical protein
VPSASIFPGTGSRRPIPHKDVPRDERDIAAIMKMDVAPYRAAIAAGLAGIMLRTSSFRRADPEPAGYSRYWLQDVLREKLAFDGLIFSDDLSMEGASTAGGIPERARAALAAGCDMVLLCQDPEGQERLLESLGTTPLASPERVERMRHSGGRDLRKSIAYREAQATLAAIRLIDHFVGTQQQLSGDGEPERLRGLPVDREVNPGRLLDRHVARLGAVQDSVHVDRCSAVKERGIGAITHQHPGFHMVAVPPYGRQPARRERVPQAERTGQRRTRPR